MSRVISMYIRCMYIVCLEVKDLLLSVRADDLGFRV